MNHGTTRSLSGRINIVQEDRFRLIDETGKAYLFDLFHSSPIRHEDLLFWKHRNSRVVVRYEGDPNFDNGVAHSISPL